MPKLANDLAAGFNNDDEIYDNIRVREEDRMNEIILGAVLITLYLVFLGWHSRWGGKLSQPEIDHYLAIINKLPLPVEEIQTLTARLRSWAEADDGKPVYTLNLMRFFPELRKFPGAPEFEGTAEEANAYYERSLRWLWLSHAAYTVFGGRSQGRNLISMEPERNRDRFTIVRLPDRRTFLKLLSDPAYGPVEPYKFVALEIDLAPVSGEMIIPDLRWVVDGSFVIIFLLFGWLSIGLSW